MLRKFISIPKNLLKKFRKTSKNYKDIISSKNKNVLSNNSNKYIGDIHLLFQDLYKKGLRINYILDIGAHKANWIRIAMKTYPECIAYLIEPLEEMEDDLKQFCNEYPGSKYFLIGAGSRIEKKYLTTAGSLEGATFLLNENKNLKANYLQREVNIVTLDSLIESKEIEVPEVIKIDVQGFELEVLKGANKLLGKSEVIILEISFFEYVKGMPIFSEVISFMAERGYEVYDFPGFLRRPFDDALGQIDVCFAKRDGFLRTSNAWYKTE